MPEKPLFWLFRPLISFLILLGTPPLYLLKIIWKIISVVGSFLIGLINLIVNLIVGVGETAVWLSKIIIIATFKLIDNLISIATSFLKRELQNSRHFWKKLGIIPATAKLVVSKILKYPYLLFKKLGSVKPLRIETKIIPLQSVALPSLATKLKGKEKLLYFLLGTAICFLVLFVPYWVKDNLDRLPNPRALSVRDIPVSTKIYDRNKILLYRIYSDENRSIISFSDIPKNLINATIAIEDTKFYSHWGIDPKGIVRAVFSNGRGEDLQGGSTLTQQLVRSALLSPERTIDRKIKEIILSFWAERIYSKQEILGMYFNQIPYGGSAYGIEAAAQIYFGKHAKDLDLAESAMLAGLPAAPTIYSPYGSHPELTKQRQRQVLNSMVKQQFITQAAADTAFNETLQYVGLQNEIKSPHFVMYVKDYLTKKYGIRAVERGGLEVITSLDYPTYEKVSQILKEGVTAQKSLSVGNGAVMITNPKTGEIITMIGSTDYFDSQADGNVNVTIAERSPGSSIKPLVYAQAFENGLIKPSTIIDDSPSVFKIAGSDPFIPQNYDNRFHGRVSARVALASSFNIPAVKVIEKVGVGNFINFAKTLGITTFTDPSRYGLSLSLGGGETKMEDMVVAFSSFANGGIKTDLKPVLYVSDYQGKVLEDSRNTNKSQNVFSSRTAFIISSILSDDSARAPTFGAGSYLNIPNHTVSVKTGTTQDKRDNWTIGYTPSLLTAVWVGNNNNSPMSPYLESGRTGAAAIWNPIMTLLLKDVPNEPVQLPNDVIAVPVCALNGLLACQYCPQVVTEYFTKGTEPKTSCNFTQEDLDRFNKEREEREKNNQPRP